MVQVLMVDLHKSIMVIFYVIAKIQKCFCKDVSSLSFSNLNFQEYFEYSLKSLHFSICPKKKRKRKRQKTKLHKFHSLSFFSKKLSSGPNIFRLARISSGRVSILFLFVPPSQPEVQYVPERRRSSSLGKRLLTTVSRNGAAPPVEKRILSFTSCRREARDFA